MTEAEARERESLESRLDDARKQLEGLALELGRIDAELDAMASERLRFGLLGDVCRDLDELAEAGGAELFWGSRAGDPAVSEQLVQARARVAGFEEKLEEIQARRDATSGELGRAEQERAWIEDELDELDYEAEQRKLEWVVEREAEDGPDRPPMMPWAKGGEDDRRLRRALAVALLASLLLGLLFPWIPLPGKELWSPEEVPERFTRLIEEREPLPPPAAVEPLQTAESEPEPAAESPVEEPKVAEVEKPTPEARKSAASKGILAFREKFSSLSDSALDEKLGAQARIRQGGDAAIGRSQRSLVATRASGSSGGIDVASLSRGMGPGGAGTLDGVEVGRVTSGIGEVGGSDRPTAGGGPGLSRSDEEIQIVFDRHKAALYRLYNRQLRKDPTLRGQMVLRLRIEPDGSVSLCEVQSSDMDAPQLSAQVAARVGTFDFGAKDGIPAITILYPIDFLPAT